MFMLQVTFLHKGYDETRRLGLRTETEQLVRDASPPGETGMLVVDSVVPGGPAYSHLEPGDVLVHINGEVITQFLRMETLFDDSVNKAIELQIERGGAPLTVNLMVQDLHSITPDHFLEVSGAVIHPLSYQQARNFRFQCGLVYVAEPGYMLFRAGIPRHAIIKKVSDVDISSLEDFITVFSKLSRGARVPLEYISYIDRHRRKSVLVTVDRHEWYAPPQIYTRVDCSGLWTSKLALAPNCPNLSSGIGPVGNAQAPGNSRVGATAGEESPMEQINQYDNAEVSHGVSSMETSYDPVADEHMSHDESDLGAKKRRLEDDLSTNGSIAEQPLQEPNGCQLEGGGTTDTAVPGDYNGAVSTASSASIAERELEPALVMFEVHVPSSCMLDGVHAQHFFGTGVIIYHSQTMGLVAVDKNTVAVAASDVMLSFAAFPIEISAEVVFLHPVHNFALVAYNPAALGAVGASAVRPAKLLPEPALRRGESVYLVGLSRSLQATSRKSIVTNPCAALNIGSADCPRYRAINMEVIELDTDFGSTFSGVLADEQGRVQAIWGSFSTQLKYGGSSSEDHQFVRGLPINTVSQILEKIVSGVDGLPLLINGIKRSMPLIRSLEVELYPMLLSKARSFGLSDVWIKALLRKDPVRRQVLRVKGCLAGSKAENLLEHNDMLLAINKEPVTCFRDIEDACQALDKSGDIDGKLHVTILRQGREIELYVGTDVRDGYGTTHVINWCGSIVQDPHPAVRALGFLPSEGHGVYVARWCHGSPVHRYGLYALQWIVEVNGKPTPDLDAFVSATKEIKHGEFVRIRTVHLNGKPRVLTLKQDLHYWPTWELRFNPETAEWRRNIIKGLDINDL
ncbi:hypothetical protein Leryth_006685 [Lithospermum erythrorhizon]|nr:hypothetical protein Leryth_006685 [Lithospermum erythrorhizon]